MKKRNWTQHGRKVADSFVAINCETEKDAERLMQMLEVVYIEGQQSVLKGIADLADAPLPVYHPQA